MLQTLLILAAVGYALLVVLMYATQRSLLYPGAGGAYQKPSGPAPWGSWVEIPTPDGERLAALHASRGNARATFIYFHGNADHIAAYGFLAEALNARGYALLAVSFRGYPGSTGSPSETGLLADGLAAFDWLSSARPGIPIIPLGRSLGSGVAVHTTAEREAAALVLVSGYDSILALARLHYPYLPVAPLIKDSFRADDWIGRVTAPKLFLHGDRDGVIPLEAGRALFEAAPEPKEFVVMRGLAHNDIWTPELVETITAFADRLLVPSVAR